MQFKTELAGRKISVNENILDRTIRFFDPIRGQKRFRSRVQAEIVNSSYTSAERGRRATKEWKTSTGDADADLLFDLPTLRERSRDLDRNDPLAGGAISTNCTNIIGNGLKLQSRIKRNILKLTEDQASAWEEKTEAEFSLFADTKNCDITRTLNFGGLQNLILRSAFTNGDVFSLLPHIQMKDIPYSLKIQTIEADRVSNPNHKADTATLAGGVEKNKNGAPIAYHILKQHPGMKNRSSFEWDKVSAYGSKTGRQRVIHLFDKKRPGQTRGIPYLSPVIEKLKQLSTLTDSELMASVVSSFFTVFIETESGGPNVLAPMNPVSEVGGKSTDDSFKMGSGAIISLAKGEKANIPAPGRPNTAFDPFWVSLVRQIGIGIELPFEVLVKHFTSSYSASRGALLEAWKFFLMRREWVADNFCKIVYETWMWEAVALGRISAPGFINDPLIRMAYLNSEWIGPVMAQIDEGRASKAATERITNRTSTIAIETAKLGGDYPANRGQQLKENEDQKKLSTGASGAVTTEQNNQNIANVIADEIESRKDVD